MQAGDHIAWLKKLTLVHHVCARNYLRLSMDCMWCHGLVLEDAALSIFVIIVRSHSAAVIHLPIHIPRDPGLHNASDAVLTVAPLSLALVHQAALLQ